MIDIDELRRLAQVATPGPWVSHGRYIGTPRHMSYIGEVRDQCGNWSDTEKSRADAAFIAAANPAAISELLDRLEAAEKDRASFLREMGRLCTQCDALRADKATLQQMTYSLKDRLEVAESARRDDYQNWMTALDRNAELLAKLEAAEKELAELRSSMKFRTSLIGRTEAERDALRAKIEQMEQQKPVMWANSSNIISTRIWPARGSVGYQHTCSETKTAYHDTPLYLARGAKGEDK